MKEKLLGAWKTIGSYAKIRRGYDRLNHHAQAVSGAAKVGIHTANAARNIADHGPSKDDIADAAWQAAGRGYDEAKSAYLERLERLERRIEESKAEADKGAE